MSHYLLIDYKNKPIYGLTLNLRSRVITLWIIFAFSKQYFAKGNRSIKYELSSYCRYHNVTHGHTMNMTYMRFVFGERVNY